MLSSVNSVGNGIMFSGTFCHILPFICLDRSVTTISYEQLELDETYSEYLLAHTDDVIRFWRSKVKVTAGSLVGEGMHVSASLCLSSSFVL